MKNKDKVIHSAIISFLALTATNTAIATSDANTNQNAEKCYGITRAGMNDCATATQSCAGSATKDRQSDAFIFVPKGVCDKIIGGNLKSKEENKT